jgi:hypothetical protein
MQNPSVDANFNISPGIIQDSNGDKDAQIGQMAKIYGNSTVAIAASRAASVQDGFLGLRTHLGTEGDSWQMAFVLPLQLRHQLSYATVVKSNREEGPEPLDHRGWTLQERILAPRVLDFRSLRTVFECATPDDPLGRVVSDG